MDGIIDAHHHFWDPDAGDYAWLSGPFAPIRRVFGPEDLRPELVRNEVAGTVLVQTWNDLEETRRFLALAEAAPFIWGVVGWVDLTSPLVESDLDALLAGPGGERLVSIRHLIQNEADPLWLLRDDVARGLAALETRRLAFDLVPSMPQLPAAAEIVRRLPKLRFVLDHISKPGIREGQFADWATLLRSFAGERDHVWCKLSGLITEADWRQWRPSDLKRYVEEALDVFGADRCMFGSDWPVCLVAGTYDEVLAALRECLTALSPAELKQVFYGSALACYGLKPQPAAP